MSLRKSGMPGYLLGGGVMDTRRMLINLMDLICVRRYVQRVEKEVR